MTTTMTVPNNLFCHTDIYDTVNIEGVVKLDNNTIEMGSAEMHNCSAYVELLIARKGEWSI